MPPCHGRAVYGLLMTGHIKFLHANLSRAVDLVDTDMKSESELELVHLADQATKNFQGQFHELESAIGMLFTGRLLGWKVLYLVHSKATIRKYENILGIKVREFFPEVGPLANKSLGWRIAQKLSNFWKEVTGNEHGARNTVIE